MYTSNQTIAGMIQSYGEDNEVDSVARVQFQSYYYIDGVTTTTWYPAIPCKDIYNGG